MKKFTKVLCAVLGIGFLVTGCATVSSIKNSSDELIYNGNSAVMVDGYLYYGNAFADYSTFTEDKDYKASATSSYLARLNTNIELAAKSKDFSPNSVEKVTEEVVGQAKSFMFVLGDYIYYATPNRQKATDDEGKSKNYYNYTTLYRSNLNGDNKQNLYTTNGEISQIEVLKYQNRYFIVMLAGENLIKIEIGNKVKKAEIVAEKVKSMAIPKTYQKDKVGSTLDWNGYIYYTVDKNDEDNPDIKGSIVYRKNIIEGEAENIYFNQGTTLSFVGREKDVLFYTLTGSETEVFTSNLTDDSTLGGFRNKQTKFYSAASISNITLIATENVEYGYLFTTSSNALGYATKSGKTGVISLQNGSETLSTYKTLFVSGRTIYLSTTTSILKADLSNVFNGTSSEVHCSTIVNMTAIYDGTLYGFDGKYIYYFAKLEEVEKDDEDKENIKDANEEEATDDNYYMYRARVGSAATDDYELLGLSKLKWRQTKNK